MKQAAQKNIEDICKSERDIRMKGKKQGNPVGHQDSMIAGNYLAAGVKNIATRNVKHFQKMPSIKVVEYKQS